jgi:class 3 adenylate cyclase
MMRICRDCGAANGGGARFCASCGRALADPGPTGAVIAYGERRQITFMFTDLVGSTQMVEHLDPEDLLDIMAAYHRAIAAAVERFGGLVVHIAGDGMMASFGYPVGLEEGAALAVHAAIAIIEAVRQLEAEQAQASGAAIAVRIGVATGMVVTAPNIGRGRIEETSFVGAAPNLAARLQTLAGSDEVVIDATTLRILGDTFAVRPIGAHILKGFDQPVHAYAVVGQVGGGSRLERRLGRTRTPMVNRSVELATLMDRWETAVGGDTQVVLVSGEAGIGKSRLLQAFHEMLEERTPHLRIALQCSAMLSNTALHPHIEQIQRMAGFDVTDDAPTRLDRLRSLLSVQGIDDVETLALLAALLSVPAGDMLPPLDMSPPLQRQRTFSALIRLLVHAAQLAPVLVVYEDLHWLDPASAAWLEEMVRAVRDSRLLLLCTTRPGSAFPWLRIPHATVMALTRLTAEHSGEMVTRLIAAADLPAGTRERIVARADGIPLYVEELTRMMLDMGAGPSGAAKLPDTLLGLLTERLDRLGPARTLAQIGAVIGASFSVELAAIAAGTNADVLRPHVRDLLSSGLAEFGAAPDELIFKHALVRDAAYESILMRNRRDLHRQIAAGMIARFPGMAESEPEAVARHLTRAGEALMAAEWWLRAGHQAIRRGAPREAVAHFEAGLEVLARLPEDELRVRAELALLAGLGPAHMVMKGPGHPDFGQVQRRAFDTTRRLPDHPAQFPITYGLALFHWGRAELDQAEPLADELLRTAISAPVPEHVMAGHTMMAMIRFHRGMPAEAQHLLAQSVVLYDPQSHARLYPHYMMDFGVFGRFYHALSSFIAGEPDVAGALAREAAELAARLNQPHSRGFAMLANFIVAAFCRDPGPARSWAEECISFAGQQGFPEFVALALIVRGWAIAEDGDPATGLTVLEQGFALWKATGFENWQSWYGVLRSDLLVALGRVTDAEAEIAEQERRIERNGEDAFRSLLVSAHASILAAAGRSDPQAEEALHREALRIAARQHASSWELRCALAYAHWLIRRGRRAKARDLLQTQLCRFGPDTMTGDLRDARALVATLAPTRIPLPAAHARIGAQ